ncbi:hypothetical protein CAPTEDRAFT_226313 [Capitella teleta]|uniref:Uncharacterized protein n=1 Tax=Capitella teleta TaxID=283909 RepID=R7UPN6_CAPTE|nr:hypothetical protein CAPTEDRAFT_226313 [Capitella teleta]|eukprot:ELU08140.1 hypothetical protein CAPTEDRAFT_226313 [Capitella teleta]
MVTKILVGLLAVVCVTNAQLLGSSRATGGLSYPGPSESTGSTGEDPYAWPATGPTGGSSDNNGYTCHSCFYSSDCSYYSNNYGVTADCPNGCMVKVETGYYQQISVSRGCYEPEMEYDQTIKPCYYSYCNNWDATQGMATAGAGRICAAATLAAVITSLVTGLAL